MAEPITCTACLAALCGAVAGPIMRACVDDVFPRLNDCLPGFLQRLFRGRDPTPAEPEFRTPAVPESRTPAVPESRGGPSKSESGGGPSKPSLPGPTNNDQINFAADLIIEHLDNEHWKLVPCQGEPRFKEVAEAVQVWFFDIKTRINFLRLSANTTYRAYLIFRTKPKQESKGLDATLTVWFSPGTNGKNNVCLKPTSSTPSSLKTPQMRPDKWMEVELAEFTCDEVTGGKEASIHIKDETDGKYEKKGLIIAGIEFRHV